MNVNLFSLIHGEIMIWGSHGDWDDYLDDFVRAAVDRDLGEVTACLEEIDACIAAASSNGNRQEILQLHGERYEWLRRIYLERRTDVTEKCLSKVKAVVLTVDLAIKIFARLSQRHKSFLQRGVSLGIVDEIHNVSRDQLFSLAAHMDTLICAGDRFQDLRDDKKASGGTCVDWLVANSKNHELVEVWRYGPEILQLIQLETGRTPFTEMVRKSYCRQGLHTLIKFCLVEALHWDELANGCVWKSRELFSCIMCCIVDAGERGASTVLVITFYERIRSALESFLLDMASQCQDRWPTQLLFITAATPGQ